MVDLFVVLVDPYFFERNGLYIGQGTTKMSRAQMFRVPKGIAVDLNDRVFKLPSFHGIFFPNIACMLDIDNGFIGRMSFVVTFNYGDSSVSLTLDFHIL